MTTLAEGAPRFLLPENAGNLIVGSGRLSAFETSFDFYRGIRGAIAMALKKRSWRRHIGAIERWKDRIRRLELAGREEEANALSRRPPCYDAGITIRDFRAWLKRGRKPKNRNCRRRR